jgi:Chaperone of endosialidase
MAITIDRTNYNALVDDDGTNTKGTPWSKNQVKIVLMDPIDAALAKAAQVAGGNTFTGVQTISNMTVGGSPPAALVIPGAVAQFNLSSSNPVIFNVPTEAANNKLWDIISSPLSLNFRAVLDGYANASYWLIATRVTGSAAINTVEIPGGTFKVGSKFLVTNGGFVVINTASFLAGAMISLGADGSVNPGIAIQNVSGANFINFFLMLNSGGTTVGAIQQNSASTVQYLTTSDARLKDDRGRATNLEALRAVVVHDFQWKADDRWDRGPFGQEAHAVFPRAVTSGDDAEGGEQRKPYMLDHSKFVPDLIVGWQQHDAAIAQLRAELLALKG